MNVIWSAGGGPFHFLSILILLHDAALSKSLLGVRVSKCAQAIVDDASNFTSYYYLVPSTLITLHLVQLKVQMENDCSCS